MTLSEILEANEKRSQAAAEFALLVEAGIEGHETVARYLMTLRCEPVRLDDVSEDGLWRRPEIRRLVEARERHLKTEPTPDEWGDAVTNAADPDDEDEVEERAWDLRDRRLGREEAAIEAGVRALAAASRRVPQHLPPSSRRCSRSPRPRRGAGVGSTRRSTAPGEVPDRPRPAPPAAAGAPGESLVSAFREALKGIGDREAARLVESAGSVADEPTRIALRTALERNRRARGRP